MTKKDDEYFSDLALRAGLTRNHTQIIRYAIWYEGHEERDVLEDALESLLND